METLLDTLYKKHIQLFDNYFRSIIHKYDNLSYKINTCFKNKTLNIIFRDSNLDVDYMNVSVILTKYNFKHNIDVNVTIWPNIKSIETIVLEKFSYTHPCFYLIDNLRIDETVIDNINYHLNKREQYYEKYINGIFNIMTRS